MRAPLVTVLLLALAAVAAARTPAPARGPAGPPPAPMPPDTLTARLDAAIGTAPSAIVLDADSLLIGAPMVLRLEFPDGPPDPAPTFESDAPWLLAGDARVAADGAALLLPIRIYRTGPCIIAWKDATGPGTGIVQIAGRLADGDRPHDVRDPRALGLYRLRVALAVLLALSLVSAVVWWRRRDRRAEAEPEIRFKAPAWMIAAREFWEIHEDGLPARGETRLFLHRTDLAMRRYLGLRHGREATEMTSSEVVAMLESAATDPSVPGRAGAWLRDCDRLRFAAGEVRPEDCQRLLEAAVREIDRTREADCPEDVPGHWRYESELCWSRLLTAMPRLAGSGGGGDDA